MIKGCENERSGRMLIFIPTDRPTDQDDDQEVGSKRLRPINEDLPDNSCLLLIPRVVADISTGLGDLGQSCGSGVGFVT